MADAVQWTIDQFWAQLQNLKTQIDQVDTGLKANATQLGAMYSTAARNYDPYRDVMIAPLIHRNTELRITYLAPIKTAFNNAVGAASNALKAAGYTTPTMNGMGVVFVIAPAAAVTLVVLALAAVAIVWRLTQANITRTGTIAAIFNDTHTTPEQKLALAKANTDAMKQEDVNAQHDLPKLPGIFDPTQLILPLLLIAAIVLVPKFVPARRAVA